MFCFALALRLGMTVGTMLKVMTSAEISEWMAFLDLKHEPAAASGGDTTKQLRQNCERFVKK